MATVYGKSYYKILGNWAELSRGARKVFIKDTGEDGWGTGTGEQGPAKIYVKSDNGAWVRTYPSMWDGPRTGREFHFDFMRAENLGTSSGLNGDGSWDPVGDGTIVFDMINVGSGQKTMGIQGVSPARHDYEYQAWYMDFDGSNDYLIYLPASPNPYPSLNPNTGMSVAMWTWSDTNHNGIFFSADDPANRFRIFQVKKKSNGDILANAFKSGGSSTFSATSAEQNNAWVHVGVTWYKDGSTSEVRLYIDGALADVGQWTGTMSTGSPNLVMGMQEAGDNNNPFNGRLGDIIFWDTTMLSASDMTDVYNQYAVHRYGH